MNAFKPGDIVTRDGTDRHVVLENRDGLLLVVCVDAPTDKWTEVGDLEHNIERRYKLLVASRS